MPDETVNRPIWWKFWRRSLLVAWVLRFVPYVRMVGLNGSMVTGRVHKKSDIDFYIVTAPGHVFTCRVFTTILVHLLGVRRHGSLVEGRVCMNRYATTGHVRITPENDYHARVFHNLIPLYSARGVYAAYTRENDWMRDYSYPIRFHEPVITDSLCSRLIRGMLELLLLPISPRLEKYFRSWQESRRDRDERVLETGSRVVLTDYELCFHLAKENGL